MLVAVGLQPLTLLVDRGPPEFPTCRWLRRLQQPCPAADALGLPPDLQKVRGKGPCLGDGGGLYQGAQPQQVRIEVARGAPRILRRCWYTGTAHHFTSPDQGL